MGDGLDRDPDDERTIDDSRPAEIAAGKRPKASLPVHNMGIGLFVDDRAQASFDRLCQVPTNVLRAPDIDGPAAEELRAELLRIVRAYWADRDRDDQATFGDIKAELRTFRGCLTGMLKALDDLAPAARRELNSDRMVVNGDRGYTDYVGDVRVAVDQLRISSDRVSAPKYGKVKAVAVPRCASELAVIWSKATGRKFVKTKDYGAGGAGFFEFTSPGVRYVQLAMEAIDPTVGFQQVHSWLTAQAQAKGRKG